MNDDELKKLWQQQPLREPAPSAAQLISAMQNKTTPASPLPGRARSPRTIGLCCCDHHFWILLFHHERAPIVASRRLDCHREHDFHRLEARSHPPDYSAGATRRDHRRITAGGTEFGARSVAFIGVGVVVVFASAAVSACWSPLGECRFDLSLPKSLLRWSSLPSMRSSTGSISGRGPNNFFPSKHNWNRCSIRPKPASRWMKRRSLICVR